MNHIAFRFKKFAALALSLGVLASLAACGGGAAAPAETGSADTAGTTDARTIKVAVAPGFYPITYADDDGNAAGYDVAVFQAVGELKEDGTLSALSQEYFGYDVFSID